MARPVKMGLIDRAVERSENGAFGLGEIMRKPVARARQIDFDICENTPRLWLQHNGAIGQCHGFFDIMRDEHESRAMLFP